MLFKGTLILVISQLFPLGGGNGNPTPREAQLKVDTVVATEGGGRRFRIPHGNQNLQTLKYPDSQPWDYRDSINGRSCRMLDRRLAESEDTEAVDKRPNCILLGKGAADEGRNMTELRDSGSAENRSTINRTLKQILKQS